MSESMTIGQLAREAQVNIETVRYYQRRGLLPKPGKPLAGYRRYPRETLDHLRFIKRAQQLGFTLREICDLLRLGNGSCAETRKLAEIKRADIRARIHDLANMQRTLERLIERCRRGHTAACPIVEALSSEENN